MLISEKLSNQFKTLYILLGHLHCNVRPRAKKYAPAKGTDPEINSG